MAFSFVLPVGIATQGENGVGISVNDTLIELPLSLRVRLLPASSLAFMTRSALGVEIGDPKSLTFVVEPISLATYHAVMLGLSIRL